MHKFRGRLPSVRYLDRTLARMHVSAFPFRRVTTRETWRYPHTWVISARHSTSRVAPPCTRPTSLPSKQVEQTSVRFSGPGRPEVYAQIRLGRMKGYSLRERKKFRFDFRRCPVKCPIKCRIKMHFSFFAPCLMSLLKMCNIVSLHKIYYIKSWSHG